MSDDGTLDPGAVRRAFESTEPGFSVSYVPARPAVSIPLGGVSAEEVAAQASRVFGTCQHVKTESVVLSTGEVVASICVNCLARLPASWGCQDCDYAEVRVMADPRPVRYLTRPCAAHIAP